MGNYGGFFMKTIFFILLYVLVFSGCGGGEEAADEESGVVLVIGSGNVFTTRELTALSGSVVTVINNDASPHTVTSESAEGLFDNSGSFDVVVGSGGSGTITLPSAESGTVFNFYCRFHTTSMTPPDGTITIE